MAMNEQFWQRDASCNGMWDHVSPWGIFPEWICTSKSCYAKMPTPTAAVWASASNPSSFGKQTQTPSNAQQLGSQQNSVFWLTDFLNLWACKQNPSDKNISNNIGTTAWQMPYLQHCAFLLPVYFSPPRASQGNPVNKPISGISY